MTNRGRHVDAGAEWVWSPPVLPDGGMKKWKWYWGSVTIDGSLLSNTAAGEAERHDYIAFLRTDGGREEKHFSVTHGIRDWPEHYRNPLLHIYKRTSLAPKAKEFSFILSIFFFLGTTLKKTSTIPDGNQSFKNCFQFLFPIPPIYSQPWK